MKQAGKTLQEIAEAKGISRERVRQILAKTGLELPNRKYGKRVFHYCPDCGVEVKYKGHHCRQCANQAISRARLKCRQFQNVVLTCENCGGLFTPSRKIQSHIRNGLSSAKGRFCNRDCYWAYRHMHPAEFSRGRK